MAPASVRSVKNVEEKTTSLSSEEVEGKMELAEETPMASVR
jgi:hypothetical protein